MARLLAPGAPGYQSSGSNNLGYYLYDGHSDVRAITSATGAVLAGYDYDPWGKMAQQAGSFDNPYRQGGAYQDAETGLYYLQSRFYSPELGRFLTEDTYTGDPADPLSLNLYTFVQNNPLACNDPTGHWPEAAYWKGLAKGVGKAALVAGVAIVVAAVLPEAAVAVGAAALIGYGVRSSFLKRAAEQAANCQDVNFLATSGVAILDAVGLSGLWEGATRKRLLTGTELSAEQAGEEMGTGLVSAAAWAAGPKLSEGAKSRLGSDPLGTLLADEGGYVQLGSGPKAPVNIKADFYVRPNGEAIPATGYRYISQSAKYLPSLDETRILPANAQGTYITFDRLSGASPGRLQVPHDAGIRLSFDTLQLVDDLRIPYGKWGTAEWLEPLARDFPAFGPGGATQAVTNLPIVVDSITRLR